MACHEPRAQSLTPEITASKRCSRAERQATGGAEKSRTPEFQGPRFDHRL